MERSRRRRGALVAGNVLVLASASMLGLAHCGSDDAPLGSAPDAAPESAPTATPTSSSSNDGGAAGDAAKEGAVPVTPVAPLWVQTFGSGGAFEMAVTPDGDVVIAASEHANGGPEDILVVKMTGAGTIV